MARPVRLGKAASELNVGVQTLIDFLKSKEIAMEFTPNTKLEEEHLEILRAEFAEDQDIKEKSKSSGGRVEVKESISLKDQRNEDKIEEPKRKEEDVQINVDEIKRQVMNIDEPVVEKKPEETKKKNFKCYR
jgi:translation initiation factor IF-2